MMQQPSPPRASSTAPTGASACVAPSTAEAAPATPPLNAPVAGDQVVLSEIKRRLREQRLRGEMPAAARPPAIPRQSDRTNLPLSFAQQRLWFFHQLDPTSPLYNMPVALRLRGRVETAALQSALTAILTRHETLRTRFVAREGEPAQVIDPPDSVPLPIVDLPAASDEALREAITQISEQPFDLAHGRLLRATLLRIDPKDHVLVLVIHHIAGDGWSWGVCLQELAGFYRGHCSGLSPTFPELAVQYGDFAVWQRNRLSGPLLDKLFTYWKTRLAGAPALLDLPCDRPRPPVQAFRGKWLSRSLGRPLTTAIGSLSHRSGATPFMTLLAAWGVLLSRYSRQTDLVVAAPVGGRTALELEWLIGFFVNTLALRLDVSGNPTFAALLERVRSTSLEAMSHQELPFDKLVEELHPVRSPTHLPVAQVAFVLQNTRERALELPDVQVTQLESWTRTAKFDLTLCVDETRDGFLASLEYNTDLFEDATAARMLSHLQVLLEGVVANPNGHVATLPLLSAAEHEQMFVQWNATTRPYPRDAIIPRLVEAHVRRAPAAVALVHGGRTMTYRELNTRANQLAHRLRRLGVGRDECVALCLERSPEMIVAVLGILKAGGAYVSLDPSYPAERLAFMLADSAARVVLTVGVLRSMLPTPVPDPGQAGMTPSVFCLDTDWPDIARERADDPPPVNEATDLAYVSYTSGSTGIPKGVCVSHRAVARLLLNTDYLQLGADDAVLQIANCAFDASTFEIWGSLLHGGRIVIVPPAIVLAPDELAQEIVRHGVTALFVTTALFNQLAQQVPHIFRTVRHVLFGGEAVNPACVRAILRHGAPARLVHVYGPTETTTFATWFEVRDVAPDAATIPIGRGLANTALYVLDEHRHPVPIGVPGELYIGGDGLARGYLNRPDLTAEKFVALPASQFAPEYRRHLSNDTLTRPSEGTAGKCHLVDDTRQLRLYRTGDLVRWRADGTIEFIGRIDRQVKIRGFRIEPAEIEAALAKHPAVRQALVISRQDGPGETHLVSYVVVADHSPTVSELRAHLRQTLPDYMVPAAFVCLPELPLNANGKVDRAALPAPEAARSATAGFAAPRDDTERRLAALWKTVLGVRSVGVNDNFFELGGHSLAGVRLMAQFEREFGRKLPLAALFEFPTVEQLAQQIRARAALAADSSLVPLQPRGTRPPLFLVHGAGVGNLWTYANLAPHLDREQPVYALESRTACGLEELPRIEDIAERYVAAIRTVQPAGPYYLGGYCFGGVIAYEMACQFAAAGENMGLLALLDSAPPNSPYHRVPWWQPSFPFRFAANAWHWLCDFIEQTPADRAKFVRRKLRTTARQFARRLTGQAHELDIDIEAAIDPSLFPAAELAVWRAHLRAAQDFHPRRYPGRATLFRTRGQPLWCSLDRQFGWGDLAAGGVDVVLIPGAHEKIFLEPNVTALAAALDRSLRAANAAAGAAHHPESNRAVLPSVRE